LIIPTPDNAQAIARGAAELLQQEKIYSVDVQRSRVNFSGFISIEAR
jgi:hypothetical protein